MQNLWLAAGAEGVGVGWVSIIDPAAVATILGLPDEVLLVAYLCVGYPVEFADRPLLERVGWETRLPLDDVIFEEEWGQRPSGPQAELASESASISPDPESRPGPLDAPPQDHALPRQGESIYEAKMAD